MLVAGLIGAVLLAGCFAGVFGFWEQPEDAWDLVPLSQYFTRGQCEGSEDIRFTAGPANPDDLSHIFPLGLMTGSHVTPVDHQYYYWASLNVPLNAYTVHSPADGVVVQVDDPVLVGELGLLRRPEGMRLLLELGPFEGL